MAKKIAPKGSSEAFLRSLVGTAEQGCILWPYRLSGAGYGLAVIGGSQKPASHWMCLLAHGEPPASKWRNALHKCGTPACVNPNHLKWGTHAENMADMSRHGTSPRGERSGRTHLTEDDVREIRAAPPKLTPLMERYGLSRHALVKIRNRSRWRHVQ